MILKTRETNEVSLKTELAFGLEALSKLQNRKENPSRVQCVLLSWRRQSSEKKKCLGFPGQSNGEEEAAQGRSSRNILESLAEYQCAYTWGETPRARQRAAAELLREQLSWRSHRAGTCSSSN